MPLYLAKHTIKVRRDKTAVRVAPGTVFDFTEDEAKTALASSPGCMVLHRPAEVVSIPVSEPADEKPRRGKGRAAKPADDLDDEEI